MKIKKSEIKKLNEALKSWIKLTEKVNDDDGWWIKIRYIKDYVRNVQKQFKKGQIEKLWIDFKSHKNGIQDVADDLQISRGLGKFKKDWEFVNDTVWTKKFENWKSKYDKLPNEYNLKPGEAYYSKDDEIRNRGVPKAKGKKSVKESLSHKQYMELFNKKLEENNTTFDDLDDFLNGTNSKFFRLSLTEKLLNDKELDSYDKLCLAFIVYDSLENMFF
jgi:hypothetical protein